MRGYDAADTLRGMQMIRGVYENRLANNPRQFMAPGATTLTDVIVAPGQTRGFSRDAEGNIVIAAPQLQQINNVLDAAKADPTGAAAQMLKNAQGVGGGEISSIRKVNDQVLYAYRTAGATSGGGNYVVIPANRGGIVGGNQFYTLRPTPPPRGGGR
jgi:hypothetical protein